MYMSHSSMGHVRLFAGERAPLGWLPCDGRTLEISKCYLRIVLGSEYELEGKTHLKLPNLEPKDGVPYYICTND